MSIRQAPKEAARQECRASRREPVLLMDEMIDRLVYAIHALLVFFALAAAVFLSYY